MSAILRHISCLESYVEHCGARLVRTALPELIHGRVFRDLITLQADLNPEQQLLALVHELAHLLAHRETGPHSDGAYSTIFEYEAEAVETLVMARLGLPLPERESSDNDLPTDSLLSSSVTRVVSTTRRICQALGVEHAAGS